ncbi:MAG TPA: hypothetical protein VGN26_07015 [Armatimonadota bacterium]
MPPHHTYRVTTIARASMLCLCLFTSVCLPGRAGAEVRRVTETLARPSVRGPYVLSWSGILTISEHITLGTSALRRGRDYTLDYSSGLLALTSPPQGEPQMVVEYDIDSVTAKPNKGGPSTAVLRLMDSDASSLRATVFFQQSATPVGNTPISAVALGGETQRQGLKLSSLLMVGTQEGGFGSRTGMKLGAGYQTGGLQLQADFASAGGQMQTLDGLGVKQGQSLLNLQGSYRASASLGFTSSLRSTDDGKGTRQSVQSLGAEYKPTDALTLQASRQVQSTSGASGDTVATNQLSVQAAPAQGVKVQAGFTQTSSDQKGSQTAETARLEAQRGTTKLQADLSHSDGESGSETGLGARVDAAPVQAVHLNAGVSARSFSGGAETGFDATVDATPLSALKLSAGYSGKQSWDRATGLDRGEGQAQVKLSTSLKKLELQAGFTRKSVDDGTQTTGDTTGDTQAQVKVSAGTAIAKVRGGYTAHYVGASTETSADAGVELAPLKPVRITAGYSQSASGANQSQTEEAQVEVKPTRAMAFTAGYQQKGSQDGSLYTRSLGAELSPIAAAKVSGVYKLRDQTTGRALDTLDAKVTLSPLKQLQVTGAYLENPEDSGAVYQAIRRSLGLQTQVGFVTLSGSYGLEERYALGSTVKTELGLGMRFAPSVELKAAYRMSEAIGLAAQQDAYYSLSYIHNLGGSFNLALEGERTAKRLPTEHPRPDYKGSAKLQVRF